MSLMMMNQRQSYPSKILESREDFAKLCGLYVVGYA